MGHVFDGLVDRRDPKVCVKKCVKEQKKNVRDIHIGDKLTIMHTVKCVDGVEVMARMQGQNYNWQSEYLTENVKSDKK